MGGYAEDSPARVARPTATAPRQRLTRLHSRARKEAAALITHHHRQTPAITRPSEPHPHRHIPPAHGWAVTRPDLYPYAPGFAIINHKNTRNEISSNTPAAVVTGLFTCARSSSLTGRSPSAAAMS